jgi:hypothetical protein
LFKNSKPPTSMKITYILGIDAAKHKVRAALRGTQERFVFEKDLPVSAPGLHRLVRCSCHRVDGSRRKVIPNTHNAVPASTSTPAHGRDEIDRRRDPTRSAIGEAHNRVDADGDGD